MPPVALGALLAIVVAPSWRPPELAVAKRAPATRFEELRDDALGYLGRPYVSGGVGSPGFDCSGLVCRVYAEAGYPLPRVSRDQARAGRAVPLDRLEPGDVLVFVESPGSKRVNHVGLYLGGGEMLHASTGQGRVVVSDLGASWYRERLVGARRFLPDPGQVGSATVALAQVTELEEHDGPSTLLPMLRLPADLPPPVTGPALADLGATSLALRAAGATELGRVGAVLVPEATLRVEDWALAITLALPVRLDPERGAVVAPFARASDALSILRGASLGLPNADLELRLDRFGDQTLARGLLVERLQPAAAVRGVVGLAAARTPLGLFGAWRGDPLSIELSVDDVVAPGVFGASAYTSLIAGWLRGGVAVATDQRALRGPAAPRAISALEVGLVLDAVATPSWTVAVSALGGAERASGQVGWAGAARVDAEYRLSRGGTRAIALRVEGARAGASFLEAPFGPTYAVARAATYRALEESLDRFTLGGELELRWGHLALAGGHHDAVGPGGRALDRRTFALMELRALPVLGTSALDLRFSWGARGLFTPEAVDVLYASGRLWIESWLAAEAYLTRGLGWEGGLGVTVAWLP